MGVKLNERICRGGVFPPEIKRVGKPDPYDFLFSKTYKAIRLVKRIVVKPKGKVKREKN